MVPSYGTGVSFRPRGLFSYGRGPPFRNIDTLAVSPPLCSVRRFRDTESLGAYSPKIDDNLQFHVSLVVIFSVKLTAATVIGTVTSTVLVPSLTVTFTDVVPAATPVTVTVPLLKTAVAMAESGAAAMAVMVKGSLSASCAISAALNVAVPVPITD